MIKVNRRAQRILLSFVVFTVLGAAIVGCEYFPESSFELANESRLPRWITLPQKHTRADVSITMNLYISLWGSNATFVLRDRQKQILTKIYGTEKGREPLYLKNPPQGFPPNYPAYEVITVNGITEIIEHRKMEPVFYITDNPDVWKELMGVQPSAGGPVNSPK